MILWKKCSEEHISSKMLFNLFSKTELARFAYQSMRTINLRASPVQMQLFQAGGIPCQVNNIVNDTNRTHLLTINNYRSICVNEGGKAATVLQELQVPVVSNEDCRYDFAQRISILSKKQFGPAVLCAGNSDGGDSCT